VKINENISECRKCINGEIENQPKKRNVAMASWLAWLKASNSESWRRKSALERRGAWQSAHQAMASSLLMKLGSCSEIYVSK